MKHLARTWARRPEVWQVLASGDGAWAFWTGKGDHGVDVFCAPLKGGHPEQLTFGPDHHDIRDVSADGMRLILGQSRNGSGHDHLLLLDRTLGNRLRLLTPKQERHHLRGGVFVPGGVIFASDENGAPTLWRLDLTSGRLEALTALPCLPRTMQAGPGGIVLAGDGLWLWDGGLRDLLAGVTKAAWIDATRIAVLGDRPGIVTLTGGVEWLEGQDIAAGHGRWALIPAAEAPGFRPMAALPQGWLGVTRDPCAPPEVWADRRLDAATGPTLDPAEVTAFGPLWRPDAPKGLVVMPPDPAWTGFFTALGWAVIGPQADLAAAIRALDLPPRVCRIDGLTHLATGVIRIGPAPVPEDVPTLRVHFAHAPTRGRSPDLFLPDETSTITRPANLQAFFLRAAAFLETL